MEFYYHRSYRGPLKAMILDWAGTTMDYGCYAPAVVFVQVFENRGVPISIDEARGPMGSHKKTHIRRITQTDSVRERWKQAHGTPPNEDDVEAMYQDFIPRQLAVLADYADLIPGTLDAVKEFRMRGLKIGSTTGYSRDMMDIVLAEAKKRGYEPDSMVCATDVAEGRPAPFMAFQNMIQLGVYPPEAVVKVGDTIPDIDEGLNAGMWTIGVVKAGNEIGLTEAEIAKLLPSELEEKMQRAYSRMAHAGAHYVADTVADVPPLLDDINARLAQGERP